MSAPPKKIPVKRAMTGGRRTSTSSAPKRQPAHDLSPTGKAEPFPSDTKAEAAPSRGEKSQEVTVEIAAKPKAIHQHTVKLETPLKVKSVHTVKVETTHHVAKGAGRGRAGINGLQKERPQPEGNLSVQIQPPAAAGNVASEPVAVVLAKPSVAGSSEAAALKRPDTIALLDKGGAPHAATLPSPVNSISISSIGGKVFSEKTVSCASAVSEAATRDEPNGASPSLPELSIGDVCEASGGLVVDEVATPRVGGTAGRDLSLAVARDLGADVGRDLGEVGGGLGAGVDDGEVTGLAQDAASPGVGGDLGLGLTLGSEDRAALYNAAPAADVGKIVGGMSSVGGQPMGHPAMWTPLCWDALHAPWSMFVNPEQAGYVGFANLPNQVHRKSVKKGFEFTLMVVGESGLGKSTLVNSLFLTDLYPERHVPTGSEKIQQTVKIDASTVEIEERGVKLRLTVVDTPGFGDSLNSTDCFKSIIRYIDDQFERYLQDESGLNRRHIIDNRVHCCFYFINPSGHGLKPLDVAFMRTVHHKVNIVPVLAKADTLTKLEVTNLKRKILDQIEDYGIKIYPLPDCDSDEDEDYKEQCRQLKNAVPFAVVGANAIIEVKGRKVRGRMYPWGVVEVENPDHCDFIKLRTMLITHMQDLQEVTQEIHYENYRAEKLANGGQSPTKTSKSAQPVHHEGVIDRERELLQKEEELRRMQEKLARMQAEIDMKRPGQHANGNIKTRDL